MPLKGRINDHPDWVFNGFYDFEEDRIGLVRSVTELVSYTDVEKTHLFLATPELVQWYADVSHIVPLPQPDPNPTSAPEVILATDGRTWRAIISPLVSRTMPYLPDIYAGTAQTVGSVAALSAGVDGGVNKVHLVNADVSSWYVDVTAFSPAVDMTPANSPSVVLDGNGRYWKRVGPVDQDVKFMQNMELS